MFIRTLPRIVPKNSLNLVTKRNGMFISLFYVFGKFFSFWFILFFICFYQVATMLVGWRRIFTLKKTLVLEKLDIEHGIFFYWTFESFTLCFCNRKLSPDMIAKTIFYAVLPGIFFVINEVNNQVCENYFKLFFWTLLFQFSFLENRR